MIPTMYWLGLSQETRKKLATLLEIPRSGHMEVVDGRIASDGYSAMDLSVVTLERLQNFLDSKSDNFLKLFDELVQNIEQPMIEITAATNDLTEKDVIKSININDLEGDIAIAPELDGKIEVTKKAKKPIIEKAKSYYKSKKSK